MRSLLLADIRKQRVLAAICASVQLVLQVASETVRVRSRRQDDDEAWRAFLSVHAAGAAVLRTLQAQQARTGRGRPRFDRMPTLLLPKSDRFDTFILLPDKFQQECGFKPAEFLKLLGEVEDVMHLCRDSEGLYGQALNRQRRARRFKYSPRERLFIFLCYCRQYGSNSFRRMANAWSWSHAMVFVDFIWLRSNLVAHPALVSRVSWGTPHEREAQRVQLQRAGLWALTMQLSLVVPCVLRLDTC